MWEQQFESIVEANHMDPETLSDFGVSYASEIGDHSLISTGINVFSLLMVVSFPPDGPISRSMSGTHISGTCGSFSESYVRLYKRSWSYISRKGVAEHIIATSVSVSRKRARYGSVMESRCP